MEWTIKQRELPLPPLDDRGESVRAAFNGNSEDEANALFQLYVRERQLRAALDEIEKLRELAGGKWISVKQELPPEGAHVLIWDGDGWDISWRYAEDGWTNWDTTHWQPLPTPPSGEQAAQPKDELDHPCAKCGADLFDLCKCSPIEEKDPKGEV